MNPKKLSTRLIHTGSGQFQKKASGVSLPETLPVYLTSAYSFEDLTALDALNEQRADGYSYSRVSTPNSDAAGAILAAADGTEEGLVFSSGLAAIVSSLLTFLQAGDHAIASSVLYGATYEFLDRELARFGIEVSFADLVHDDIAALIRPNTRLIYTETISNPLMEVPDLDAIAAIAHQHGLLFLVDNTFASPVVARPIAHGADIVLYSATKYLSGHADIVAGAVSGRRELVSRIRHTQLFYGTLLDVQSSWLLARSLRTLDLRMRRHSENALLVARFLENHAKVEQVFYPGLPSSPSYQRAERQFENRLFGGMLSVNLSGGEKAVAALIEKLQSILFVPSLAGPATTVSYPVKTSHRFYRKELLDKLGITPGQIRFSIGLEASEDIIAEISEALDAI